MKSIILNGFDRCGSSAIARTLALHPDIELIMQPFNGSNYRKNTYKIFDNELASDEDMKFLRDLEGQKFSPKYINSKWHSNFSTTNSYQKGKVHILKTTQNHFSVHWIKQNYPSISIYGIWRNPYEILNSIINNGFHNTWYKDAYPQLIETIRGSNQLSMSFEESLHPDNSVQKVALIISVKSHFFFGQLKKKQIINYHNFLNNSDFELNKFIKQCDLDTHTFGDTNLDLNIVGNKYVKGEKKTIAITDEDLKYIKKCFEPLKGLMFQKFQIEF